MGGGGLGVSRKRRLGGRDFVQGVMRARRGLIRSLGRDLPEAVMVEVHGAEFEVEDEA